MSEMEEKELAQITNCAMCANMCKHSCPAYLASGSETNTPQKIARLILYEEKAFIEDRNGFCDVMFRSAMCGACRKHCIYDDYDLRKYIQKGRRKAFKEGILPDETRKRVEMFMKYGNPNGERQFLDRGTGDTGYFVACSVYQDNGLLKAMERIISASGEQVRWFGGADLCCGAPLYYAGDMGGFTKTANKMAEEIATRKLKKVITDCPNCLKMMIEIYHEVGVNPDAEFSHTTEFLNSLIGRGRIKVNRRDGTATYHDPCILANDLDITEAPREIIAALGLEVKEPVYSGGDTHCCGGPGGVRIGDSGLNDKVRSMRVDELKVTGADLFLTSCPTCKAVLADSKMRNLSELVAEQLTDER